MRSSNGDVSRSFVRASKLVEAIQMSWDHEGMIAQEDGGFEPALKNFALNPCDFALHPQVVRNFTLLPRLSCSLLDFALPQQGSAEFHATT